MPSRLLAVVAAIAMIGGAFVYRYGVPGGGDGGSDGTGSGNGGGVDAGAVICAAELGPDVCEAVGDDVTFEPAATTADRLVSAGSAAEAGIAVWIVPGPWSQMVDAARGTTRPALFAKPEVIASSPLVAVTKKAQPIATCAGAVTWRCLGDAAQDPAFRLAADPDTNTVGLLVRAAALGGFLGSADYASNDLDEVPDASNWLGNLDRSLDRAGSFGAGTVARFVAAPAVAQGYVTTAAAAGLATSRPELVVSAPTPAAVVGVIIARPVRATGKGDVDVDGLRKALVAAGWKAEPPPGDDGLPSPGVLVALRGRVG